METVAKAGSAVERDLPEALARTLRHEVGDLLQTVYATVAILQKRLPADWNLERRILTDMRNRAETCKRLLDMVHDYVCPMDLHHETVDLAEVVEALVKGATEKFPQLEISLTAPVRPQVSGDRMRILRVGELLLTNACQAAQRRVCIEVGLEAGGTVAEWKITDDGPGVPPEHMERLFTPFFTTRHGHIGLGLALAHKVVQLHDGQISAENTPQGGLRITVQLPVSRTGKEECSL